MPVIVLKLPSTTPLMAKLKQRAASSKSWSHSTKLQITKCYWNEMFGFKYTCIQQWAIVNAVANLELLTTCRFPWMSKRIWDSEEKRKPAWNFISQPVNQPASQSVILLVSIFSACLVVLHLQNFIMLHINAYFVRLSVIKQQIYVIHGCFITLYSLAPTCFGFSPVLMKEYPLITRRSYKDTILCTSNKQLRLLTNVTLIYL